MAGRYRRFGVSIFTAVFGIYSKSSRRYHPELQHRLRVIFFPFTTVTTTAAANAVVTTTGSVAH